MKKHNSKQFQSMIFDLTEVFQSPVITFSQSWATAIPERLLKIITVSRMKNLYKNVEMASYPEVVAYMITRTYEAPLTSDWFEIYMHVSCTVCEQYWNQNCWEELEGKRNLNDYQLNHLLISLQKWIYKKRREAFMPKFKESKKTVFSKDQDMKPIIPVVEEYQQLSLF